MAILSRRKQHGNDDPLLPAQHVHSRSHNGIIPRGATRDDGNDRRERAGENRIATTIALSFLTIYAILNSQFSALFSLQGEGTEILSPTGKRSSVLDGSSSFKPPANDDSRIVDAGGGGGVGRNDPSEIATGERLLPREKDFVSAARSLLPITDKVTTHGYHPMYGRFLLPYYRRKPGMKMLEIGLGCDMNYEPGASVALWKKLFPKANLWEAEYNATCVEVSTRQGKLDGFNTLVGDQGDDNTLDDWIRKSGGEFDVVIDDGGHHNCQITTSFDKLWPELKPGGLYFIEDMQVGKWRGFRRASTPKCDARTFTFSERLKEWIDDLIYQGGYMTRKWDVQFMYCQAEACVLGKEPAELTARTSGNGGDGVGGSRGERIVNAKLLPEENAFVEAAGSLMPITDKITTHSYHTMYGRFLLPYYDRTPDMKMLEIGLGCDMNYEPGASVALWKKLFPKANLWEAEYNATCVEVSTRQGKLDGFNVLVGDQGNNATLDGWIETSGGDFDVIIDDGGHHNCQIMASFVKLWPTIKPGGLYFIEDLSVGKWRGYQRHTTSVCPKSFVFSTKLKEWVDDLIYQGAYGSRRWDVQFMFCQAEACVLGKKPEKVIIEGVAQADTPI